MKCSPFIIKWFTGYNTRNTTLTTKEQLHHTIVWIPFSREAMAQTFNQDKYHPKMFNVGSHQHHWLQLIWCNDKSNGSSWEVWGGGVIVVCICRPNLSTGIALRWMSQIGDQVWRWKQAQTQDSTMENAVFKRVKRIHCTLHKRATRQRLLLHWQKDIFVIQYRIFFLNLVHHHERSSFHSSVSSPFFHRRRRF